MVNHKEKNRKTREFEEALEDGQKKKYVLRLYVTGTTPRSMRAIRNIKKLCEEHLKGRYELEVVDIYQQPGAARDEDVLATPTLVKKLPLPIRRLIGDLSDMEHVLVGLNIIPKEE
jgi:circadian clock protein KaiB